MDEILAPLAAEECARVKQTLRKGELKEVLKTLDDTERPNSLGEAARFWVAGVGAYMTHGLTDGFDVRIRLKMPGQMLSTNGGLGTLPEVEWELCR